MAASATVVTLSSANLERQYMSFYNDSTDTLYIKLGTGATTSDYTVKVVTDAFYEAPPAFSGPITGIWDGTNGACLVTEIE